MVKKKTVVPQVVIEKKPKVKYVSKLKEYAVNFDATIKVHQGGFESILPWCIKEDKNKFANLSKEQVEAKVLEAIKSAFFSKCPWVSEIVSIDNIKYPQELINNE